jgi:hypothetical protein
MVVWLMKAVPTLPEAFDQASASPSILLIKDGFTRQMQSDDGIA